MSIQLGSPIWQIWLPENLELPNSSVLIPLLLYKLSIEKFILWDCERKRRTGFLFYFPKDRRIGRTGKKEDSGILVFPYVHGYVNGKMVISGGKSRVINPLSQSASATSSPH